MKFFALFLFTVFSFSAQAEVTDNYFHTAEAYQAMAQRNLFDSKLSVLKEIKIKIKIKSGKGYITFQNGEPVDRPKKNAGAICTIFRAGKRKNRLVIPRRHKIQIVRANPNTTTINKNGSVRSSRVGYTFEANSKLVSHISANAVAGWSTNAWVSGPEKALELQKKCFGDYIKVNQ